MKTSSILISTPSPLVNSTKMTDRQIDNRWWLNSIGISYIMMSKITKRSSSSTTTHMKVMKFSILNWLWAMSNISDMKIFGNEGYEKLNFNNILSWIIIKLITRIIITSLSNKLSKYLQQMKLIISCRVCKVTSRCRVSS